MFALSTVIQCAIQSYYPLTNDTVVKENWDSLDSIVQYMYIHGIILMAVQLNMSISFVVLRCHRLIWLIEEFHPCTNNHFVTLRKPVKVLQPGDHYFKAHLPTLTTKKQTTGTKRKQVSLDALLVKRACNTQETVDSEIKCPSTSKGISSITPNTGPTSEKSPKHNELLPIRGQMISTTT